MTHKMNRMVLYFAILTLVVFMSLVGELALAAVTYQTVDWTPQGYGGAELYSTNGTQLAGCGWSSGTQGSNHALLWNGTKDNPLDLNPAGFVSSSISDISNTGQVGSAFKNNEIFGHAIFWSGTAGSAVDLTPNGYYYSYGLGIGGGQQVGSAMKADQSSKHGFLWSGTAASAIDLNPAGFTGSVACATNGTQQAGSGWGPSTGNTDHALLWSGTAASVVDLHPSGIRQSGALGMCGTQLVGFGFDFTMAGRHAYLWNGTAASAVDLHPAGFDWTEADATNGLVQVGYGIGTATGGNQHAMAWSGTAASAVDLHQLLGPGFRYSHAEGIDSQGNIVGYAVDTSYRSHAVLWVPVPEPSALILLGMGALGLLGFVRRRRVNFRILVCLIALSVSMVGLVRADGGGTPAVTTVRVGGYVGGISGSNTYGWQFHVNSDISATQLGIWDLDQNGLNFAHEVGLWDANGQLLASATVPAGTEAASIDDFRYVPINPVTLSAGQSYMVGALYSPFEMDPILYATMNIDDVSVVAPASSITLVGMYFTEGPSLSYPGTFSASDEGVFGPSFTFVAVPEPGTIVLLGMGAIGGLVWWRRRF